MSERGPKEALEPAAFARANGEHLLDTARKLKARIEFEERISGPETADDPHVLPLSKDEYTTLHQNLEAAARNFLALADAIDMGEARYARKQ